MLKNVIKLLPEFITTFFAMIWFIENYIESGRINYFALLAGLLIIIAAISKSRPLGMIMGVVAVVFSLFIGVRCYDLLKEINDVATANRFFYVLGSLFIISLLSGVFLFLKYYRQQPQEV